MNTLKKLFSIFLVTALSLQAILLAPHSDVNVQGASSEFTLSALPTPRNEVMFDEATTSVVGTSEEFIAAYTDATPPSTHRIVLANSITFSPEDVQQLHTYSLDRDLQIDGTDAKHTLSFSQTQESSIFQLSSANTEHTLHLKNLQFERTKGNKQKAFLSSGSQAWDIIFENVSNTSGIQFENILQMNADTSLYFRGENGPFLHTREFALGVGRVVFEDESHFDGTNAPSQSNAVFSDTNGGGEVYFGKESTVKIQGQRGASVFYRFKTIDLYPSSNVELSKTNDMHGVMNSASEAVQTYRIDAGARFVLKNGSGPALDDYAKKIDVQTNPGATVELVGNAKDAYGIVTFNNKDSRLSLNQPAYYNIQNMAKDYPALYIKTEAAVPAFSFKETNIGFWALGTLGTSAPTLPSPFGNVSLYAGNGVQLDGTSSSISTLPGGYSTKKYSRIAYSVPPTIEVQDQRVGVQRTKALAYTATPEDGIVTFVSKHPEIVSVDAKGNITGVSKGTGTVVVRLENKEHAIIEKEVDITVTNDMPVLEVPSFTRIPVGSSFDAYEDVHVQDEEDGTLRDQLSISGAPSGAEAGVYQVHYQVTDSHGNTVSKKRVVLVDDGTYAVGDAFILRADDFKERLSMVLVSKEHVLEQAGVVVYSKTTGARVEEPLHVEFGTYEKVVGTHKIQISVESESELTRDVTAHVHSGSAPQFEVSHALEVERGTTFDPYTNITAMDEEDGDVTRNINVAGNVDTEKAGLYKLQYEVKDSDGNVTRTERTVLVNDGTYTLGTNYVLRANSITHRPSTVDTSLDAIRKDANVVVYDLQTLQEVEKEVTVDLGGYSNHVGTYTITFRVVGEETTARTVEAHVKPGDAPVLDMPRFTEVAYGDVFDPKQEVIATDTEDGLLTSAVEYSGNVNTTQPGFYTISAVVTDRDGNKTQEQRVVLVNDGTYHVGIQYILKASDFRIRLGQVSQEEAAVKAAADVHVYSRATYNEVDVPLLIDTSQYIREEGEHPITISILSEKLTSRTVKANVHKGEVPVLSVPKFTTISLNEAFDPYEGVVATDREDGNVTPYVVANSSVVSGFPGVYLVEYRVGDTDTNITTATQVVVVNSGSISIGNRYMHEGSDFTLRSSEVTYDSQDIRERASYRLYNKETGLLSQDAVQISYGDYGIAPGVYPITFTPVFEPSASRTVYATVHAGLKPELTVPVVSEVPVNGDFDFTKGVQGVDVEDGNISSSIKIKSSVDFKTPGIYEVEYTLEDRDFNSVQKTQHVVVNDGRYSVAAPYVLEAQDAKVRVSEVEQSLEKLKEQANIHVYNLETGKTDDEPIGIDFGTYAPEAGVYTLHAYLLNHPEIQTTFQIEVHLGKAPEIHVPNFREIPPYGLFDPEENIKAIDEEDGVITERIWYESFVFTPESGVYLVEYYVRDVDGNTATATQVVVVNDGRYIIGENYILEAYNFEKRISEVDTRKEAVTEAAAARAFNKRTGRIVDVTYDVSLGTYKPAVGLYTIIFTVHGDHMATKAIKANVVKGLGPRIEAPAIVTIQKGEFFDELLSVTATDPEDGDVTSRIQTLSEVDKDVLGVYPVTHYVTDSDGNEFTLVRFVEVQ